MEHPKIKANGASFHVPRRVVLLSILAATAVGAQTRSCQPPVPCARA
jgi:hypothetical protein